MPRKSAQTTRRQIHDGWKVKELSVELSSPACTLPWLPASVPGHVHLDLMRAGVLQDPFYRLGERGAQWVDHTDWIYETTFNVEEEPPESAVLLFHGLDTVAEVTLNGEELGHSDNMFIAHEFPVGGRLQAGENRLRVTFRSALRVGWERQNAWNAAGNPTVPRDWFWWNARSFVRKAQYMYGWDWGPEPVSCGIWQPVELVSIPVARMLDWQNEVRFSDDGSATVELTAFVERPPSAMDTPLTLSFSLPEVSALGEESQETAVAPVTVTVPSGEGRIAVKAELTVPNPRRWNPVGRGEPEEWSYPALYRLEMALKSEDGETVDTKSGRIGLRTVELIQEPDDDGESFKFRVNGDDLFIKGANWIPAHSFPSLLPSGAEVSEAAWKTGSRAGQDRVKALLEAAHEAGMNMLRIWGGGLYESEHFYTLCDELGILVWQDFPYACAYYPDTGDYAETAKVEATAAVRRLRVHPSLAIWCGNNENHQLYHDGWGGQRPPRFLGENLYHQVLPAVVEDEDPNRPYWPSSPYKGDNPNSADVGDRHDWDVWHGIGDWVHYREDRSRFCSEFGFASSCGMATWDSCLAEMDKEPNSIAVRWHDKTRKGYETYLGYIRLHYPAPQTLEDLVYFSQINQAEAMKCGIEHWRRLKGRCWGTLVWQLNDCWPVQSWAMIDSSGEPKAAWYWSKEYNASVLLSLVRHGDAVEAHLTNDLLQPVSGAVTLTLETLEGERLSEVTLDAQVDANGTRVVGSLDLSAAQGREREVVVCGEFLPNPDSAGDESANVLLLAEPKDLLLADPGITVEVLENDEESHLLTVTAKRFAPYIWLRLIGQPDWIGKIEWSDNFFHLRAGETKELLLYTSGLLETPEEARTRLEIRTL